MTRREGGGGSYGAALEVQIGAENIHLDVEGLSSPSALLERLAAWLTIVNYRLNMKSSDIKSPAQIIADIDEGALKPE